MKLRARFRVLPIRSKLTLLLMLPCAVVLGLSGAIVFWFQTLAFRQGFDRNLAAAAAVVAEEVVVSVNRAI